MPLDPRDAAAVDTVTGDCRRLFGERLRALALYGEAATEAYRPRRTPLETVLLLDRIDTADLQALRARMTAWYRLRLAIPLVIDPAYLATSRDVFPLELLELRDRHRLLHGAEDPFATLPAPSLSHLRLELEQQLKGKLLHLRESYLALGRARRGMDALLRAACTTLDVILRGVLALAERPRPLHAADVMRAVEELHGVALPGLTRLDRWADGMERPRRRELEAVFTAVHDHLATLVQRIDHR
jgi:hypothetical protein